MSIPSNDPLWHIAEQVADCFSDSGYAFIEDDKIEGLATVLQSFLTVAGISVHAADARATIPLQRPTLVGARTAGPGRAD